MRGGLKGRISRIIMENRLLSLRAGKLDDGDDDVEDILHGLDVLSLPLTEEHEAVHGFLLVVRDVLHAESVDSVSLDVEEQTIGHLRGGDERHTAVLDRVRGRSGLHRQGDEVGPDLEAGRRHVWIVVNIDLHIGTVHLLKWVEDVLPEIGCSHGVSGRHR